MSEDALRATGLMQPGSLVRWHYRVRLPASGDSDAAAQAVDRAGAQAIAASRLGHPQPQQCLAAAAAQRRALHAIPHHCRPDRAAGRRRRRRQRGEEPSRPPARDHRHLKALGASGRRVFAIYLTQVLLLALIGGVHRRCAGRGVAVRRVVDFRRRSFRCRSIPALHPAELALAMVYGLLTALAFALWPLGRAHDVPVGALFRDVVAAQPRWPRRIYIVVDRDGRARCSARWRCCSPMTGASPSSMSASRPAVFVLLRLVGSLLMCDRAPRAARALDRPAHGGRQYPPARRADADHRAVARPRHRAAGHGDRDRRQSAPAIRQRTAGQGAVVLFPRHPGRPGQAVRRLRARAGARRQARGSADAARPHRLGQRHHGRRPQAEGRSRLGAAKRPRHHL